MSVDAPSGHRWVAFFAGPVAALVLALLPTPEGMSPEAQRVAALAVWMAIWWATEAAPIAATSLLPLVALPLIGAASEREAAAGYASPIVLLLMGGFILALAIERWRLHSRIALSVLTVFGDRPRAILAGFLVATAAISMWISNTATALMMMPIALSVAAAAGPDAKGGFARALVLAVVYAASIGGVATPVGTPTNLIAMNWIGEELDRSVSFASWMAVGVPTMLALLPAAWLILLRDAPKSGGGGAGAAIQAQLKALGPISVEEGRVLLIFALVAGLWAFGEPLRALGLGMSDMAVAILGALLVLLVPASRAENRTLLSWSEAAKIPWGVVLLFGGGISLADAMERTGLGLWLGDQLAVLGAAPPLVLVLVVTALVIVMTEFMSNVATITMLLPVLGALSIAVGVEPLALVVPAAIAASCGFMMPAGTGPNAVGYGTGAVSVGQMMDRGFRLNLMALIVMTAAGYWLAPMVFG